MNKTHKKLAIYMALALMAVGTQARADDDDNNNNFNYEITVTNVTRGQSFTPILVATHRAGVNLFTEGSPASPELALVAEDGDTVPLEAKLRANPNVLQVTTTGDLDPGKSVTVKIRAQKSFDHISLTSMLVTTNDAFFALNGVRGPRGSRILSLDSPAYDAGSEPNDELCANIPGPICRGQGASPNAGGEGFVHIHAGIHGIGNLSAADRDWRNPVAEITIRRVP